MMKRYIKILFAAMLVMSLSSTPAKATDIGRFSNDWTVQFVRDDGNIDNCMLYIRFLYHHNQNDDGWWKDTNGADFRINGHLVGNFDCDDEYCNTPRWITRDMDVNYFKKWKYPKSANELQYKKGDNGTYLHTGKHSDCTVSHYDYATIPLVVNIEDVATKETTVNIKGTYWRWGGWTDEDVDDNIRFTASYDVNPGTYKIVDVDLDAVTGQPYLKLQLFSGNSSTHSKYYLYQGSNVQRISTVNFNSKEAVWDRDDKYYLLKDQGKFRAYDEKAAKTFTAYAHAFENVKTTKPVVQLNKKGAESIFVYKGFPVPSNLCEEYNFETNEVELKWTSTAIPDYAKEGQWVIERTDVTNNVTEHWTAKLDVRSFKQQVNENTKYRYRVYYNRLSWNNENRMYDDLATKEVSFTTTNDVNLSVQKTSYSDKIHFDISFRKSTLDKFYCLTITRDGIPVKIISEIPNTVNSETWEDTYDATSNPLNSNVSHNYEFTLTRNSNKAFLQSASITAKVTGGTHISGFTASSGVKTDNVLLHWKAERQYTDTYIDHFRLAKRQCSSAGDFITVEGAEDIASTSIDNTFTDSKVTPGVMYEYRLYIKGQDASGKDTWSEISTVTGFVLSTGSISGRIMYAEKDGSASSVAAGGTDVVFSPVKVDNSVEQAFTMRCRMLKDTSSKIAIPLGTDRSLLSNGYTYSYWQKDQSTGDKWCHYAYVHDPKTGDVLYTSNADSITSTTAGESFTIPSDSLRFGPYTTVTYIDEVQLWNRALTKSEVYKSSIRHLSGDEDGLLLYLPMDESFNNGYCYDLALNGSQSRGHHAKTSKTVLAGNDAAPVQFRTTADANGNYSVKGLPFDETDGDITYVIIPQNGAHSFSPAMKNVLLTKDTHAFSECDFVDETSITISGKAYYRYGNFPVAGAKVLIDDNPVKVTYSDGNTSYTQDVTTDYEGKYSVVVSSGSHRVSLSLDGHKWTTDVQTVSGIGNVKDLDFEDKTLMKLWGRVAGGSLQCGRILPSYNDTVMSDANIGQATLYLRPATNYGYTINTTGTDMSMPRGDSRIKDDCVMHAYNPLQSNDSIIVIKTDSTTGEFCAQLPPISYTITGGFTQSVSNDSLGASKMPEISPVLRADKCFTDTCIIQFDPEPLMYIMDGSYRDRGLALGLDSIKVGADRYSLFSFENFDPDYPDEKILADVKYKLDHPVLRAGSRQCFVIDIMQPFYNAARNSWTEQPLPEGTKISFLSGNLNGSDSNDENTITVNKYGTACYFFTVCEPNRTNSDAKSTLQASFTLRNHTYVYPKTPLEFIVIGDNVSDGTGYITQAPDQVDFVLHRPPGSNSSATLSKGSTIISQAVVSKTDGDVDSWANNFNINAGVAWKIAHCKQYWKLAFTETKNTSNSNDKTVDGTTVHTSVFTESISTGSGAKYVGSRGNVYIGHSNIKLIGTCYHYDFVKDIPAKYTDAPRPLTNDAGKTCYLVGYNSTTCKFATERDGAFAYTKTYIEETLIPEEENVRNSFLLDWKTDTTNLVFPDTTRILYYSLVPATDPNFGKEGFYKRFFSKNATADDKGVNYVLDCNSWIAGWKKILARDEEECANAANCQTVTLSSGSTFGNSITRNASESKVAITSYAYNYTTTNGFSTNTEITWNRDKMGDHAKSFTEGSFNDLVARGTWAAIKSPVTLISHLYESYKASQSQSVAVAEPVAANSKGVIRKIAGTGATASDFSWVNTDIEKFAQTVTNSQGTSNTISYTINDADPHDYLTVEVDTTRTGTLTYKLVGGATTNPWEGPEVTKYYNPGTVISKGTLKVEKPTIKLEQSNLVDIPNGHKAVLTLNISNASEINIPQYYNIGISAGSNPDGLVVEMDGRPLAQGVIPVWLEAGQTITKTLSVYQSRQDVMDYNDITLTAGGLDLQLFEMSNPELRPTAKFSIHFKPSCSDITMTMTDQSGRRINTLNQVTSDTVRFSVTDYDLSYKDFQKIQLQRYDRSLQRWQTFHEWYLNTQEAIVNNADSVCGRTTLTYDYNMHSMADDSYLMRAVTVGLYGTEMVSYEAPEQTLVKDCSAPQLLDNPNPVSGTLTPEGEISVTFNEDIYKERIVSANLSVTGNLNNEKLLHNTGLQFVGGDPVLGSARQTISTDSTSMEMWLRRNQGEPCVVFGHGKGKRRFAFGFDKDDHIWVKVGKDTIVSQEKISTSDWQFLHVGFYKKRLYVSTLWNGSTEAKWVINPETKYTYSTGAVCRFGDDFKGIISQVSMWNAPRTDLTVIAACKDLPHTSAETGIQNYWPCSECHGTVASDVISHRSLNLQDENSWYISQVNHSAHFTGTDSIAYNINELRLDSAANQTIAFWMRPETVTGSQTLIATPAGNLTLENGIPSFYGIPMTKNALAANKWHHLALRYVAQKTLSLLVNGEPTFSMDVDSIAKKVNGNSSSSKLYYTIGKGFHGWIDEVSFWQCTFPNDVVRYNMYRRMNGTEPGLKLLVNMEDADLMTAHGNALQAVMAPSLQPSRVEQNVDFTWTVSDRKIVITPTEQPYLLEGCTLTCTLDKIADTHGNDILAPITWNVLVNRSTLSLSDDIIKLENDSTSWFTIVNKSGVADEVTIGNVPSWLNLSETSFSLAPLASKTITLSGSQSVPAGYYETTLQLTSQQTGISEIMDVEYEAGTDERPHWTVNPDDFNTSCSVIAVASGEETYSDDEEDMVAAYVLDDTGQPVYLGVAKNTYVSGLDDYRFLMNLYFDDDMKDQKYSGKLNMKNDRTIHYVYWDDSEALIYSGVGLYGYDEGDLKLTLDNLQPYKAYGTPTAPCQFRRTDNAIVQRMPYSKGWNWVSLYTNTTTRQFTDYFPADGKMLSVKAQTTFANYEQGKWTGELPASTNLYYKNMYMVKAAEDFEHTVQGTQISPSGNAIRIAGNGWTWLPYYPAMRMPVEDALRNLALEGDMVKSQQGFAYYTADGWVGTLDCMEQGKGYMYYRTASKTADFTYPDSYTPIYNAAKRLRAMSESVADSVAYAYPMNMSAIIIPTSQGSAITSGTLYAYDQQGNLRGIAELGNYGAQELRNSGTVFLTISGEEKAKISLVITDGGQQLVAHDAIDYVSNTIIGTPQEPRQIVFNVVSGIDGVAGSKCQVSGSMYNIAGQKLDVEPSSGIIIKDNKKIAK